MRLAVAFQLLLDLDNFAPVESLPVVRRVGRVSRLRLVHLAQTQFEGAGLLSVGHEVFPSGRISIARTSYGKGPLNHLLRSMTGGVRALCSVRFE